MEKRAYIRKAFQNYQSNKNSLFWREQELKTIPVPGETGLDYSRVSVDTGSSVGGVEKQFVKYADDHAVLLEEIKTLRKKVELVKRTISHFEIERRAKGKRHYEYIQQRWLLRRSYRRAAIECGVAERTASFWIEEIYTVAEAIAESYDLF